MAKKIKTEVTIGGKKATLVEKAETTLILAYDIEDNIVPQSIHIFYATHRPMADVVQAVKNAFHDWVALTSKGKDFVDENGSNWGDAIDAAGDESFAKFLRQGGILTLDTAEKVKGGFRNRLSSPSYDWKIIVDHNVNLAE